ncbi:MAG: hypothetical protein KDI32_05875 [Pseudomonadales bacterium]|nr:hypothetical protein [Pseudomonadales bacterium]
MMDQNIRVAGVAALFIAVAFAVHLLNAYYFEPQMGFRSVADYMSADRLRVGLRAESWTWSGYGHFVTGIALIVMAAVVREWFVVRRPVAATLTALVGALAGIAFLLIGVMDLQGRDIALAYDRANPGNTTAIVLAAAYPRQIASLAGLILLGWFIVQFTWCAREFDKLPRLFGFFSYVAGVASFWVFRSTGAYAIAYLLIPLWALGVGIILYSRSRTLAEFEPQYV